MAPDPMMAMLRANMRAGEIRAEAGGPSHESRLHAAPLLRGAPTHSCAHLLQALNEDGWRVVPHDPETDRLRAQNKAHAERRDREQAAMEAQIAKHKNSIEEARRRMEHAAVDWTTDPPSQRPGGWWGYTSMNNIAEVVALVEQLERMRDALDIAHEFINAVTAWEGQEDDCDEALATVDGALEGAMS